MILAEKTKNTNSGVTHVDCVPAVTGNRKQFKVYTKTSLSMVNGTNRVLYLCVLYDATVVGMILFISETELPLELQVA